MKMHRKVLVLFFVVFLVVTTLSGCGKNPPDPTPTRPTTDPQPLEAAPELPLDTQGPLSGVYFNLNDSRFADEKELAEEKLHDHVCTDEWKLSTGVTLLCDHHSISLLEQNGQTTVLLEGEGTWDIEELLDDHRFFYHITTVEDAACGIYDLAARTDHRLTDAAPDPLLILKNTLFCINNTHGVDGVFQDVIVTRTDLTTYETTRLLPDLAQALPALQEMTYTNYDISPDGKLFAILTEQRDLQSQPEIKLKKTDTTVMIYDLETGQEVGRIKRTGTLHSANSVSHLLFCAPGEVLLYDYDLRVLDDPNQSLLWEINPTALRITIDV